MIFRSEEDVMTTSPNPDLMRRSKGSLIAIIGAAALAAQPVSANGQQPGALAAQGIAQLGLRSPMPSWMAFAGSSSDRIRFRILAFRC